MCVCGCLDSKVLISILGEQWLQECFPPIVSIPYFHLPPFIIMSQNSKLLRALRRIADTSRKFNRKHSTATPNVPTVLRSLPEHKPLLPLLLSHDIPLKLAKACADRYDRYANQLRSETETQLVPYLVNHRKNVPIRVYLLFFSNYTHALRDWAQSTLNAALKCLKRQPVELTDWDAASSPPLWIPVGL